MLVRSRHLTASGLGPGLLLCLAAGVPGRAVAQERPAQDERAALAEAAENAPLFAAHDPLVVTLEADIQNLKRERDEELEREGSLTFPGPDGQPMTVSIKLTTRGIFRLDRGNCNFPPLRLDLPRGRVEGTVFDGQNRLKLVSPCNDRREDSQLYVLLEYLVYRTFNLLTPLSYRVRLLEITFRDTSGENEERTRYGFLIEDVDRLAERHFAVEAEFPQFHPYNMEDRQAALVDLFEFMIGNTDWSAPFFHNIKMIRADGPTYYVIPFDFDFSGAVDADYAEPDPDLGLRDVRERLYRGFCRDDVDFASLVALFNERRDAIYAIVRDFDLLEERERNRLLEYYDGFYDIINNEGRRRRDIERACRRPSQ